MVPSAVSVRPNSIRATGREPVNFQEFSSRFERAISISRVSPIAVNPGWTENSTVRSGCLRRRRASIAFAMAVRSRGARSMSARVTRANWSRSSISCPMRWLSSRTWWRYSRALSSSLPA